MSPPESTSTRLRTPATGLKTGRSTARCVAVCRLNTLPGYVPAWSPPKAAHKAGKLPEDAWNTLRKRFNALQELAIREFGKESLQEVLQSFSPKNYRPPALRPEPQDKPVDVPRKDWIYPGNQAWKCKQPVTSQAVAKVDTIREEAMAKGWSEARLYQNQGRFRFPCGEDYGLVCFVDGDQEIGEVTERSIEIIHGPKSGRPSTLRFYNPDVPQPWMKKVED